jgi:hypothetical protein
LRFLLLSAAKRAAARLHKQPIKQQAAAATEKRFFTQRARIHSPQSSHPNHTKTKKALIDAPGMIRRTETFKRLTLTDFKLEIPRQATKKVVLAKWGEAGASLFFGAGGGG